MRVDFSVNQGEIFGLIGADGAGKTTAFKLMSGVMEPTSGELRRARQQTARQPRAGRLSHAALQSLPRSRASSKICAIPPGCTKFPDEDFDQAPRRTTSACLTCDRFQDRLAGAAFRRHEAEAGALAARLIADPAILLLDEPTTGVDPVSRRDFWDALTSLATEGITIVVATPYFDEAERCHRVALMERGPHLRDRFARAAFARSSA